MNVQLWSLFSACRDKKCTLEGTAVQFPGDPGRKDTVRTQRTPRAMTTLTRGANTAIDTAVTTVAVSGARPGTVDLLVFQLGLDWRVRSDADLIFFNNPSSPENAVRLGDDGRIHLDLHAVPAGVETLSVAVALDDGAAGSLADVPGLGVTVDQPSGHVAAPAQGLTTERAAVLLEVYRRGGAWKVRNASAGWDAGLAALATEHGVTVDETPASAPVVRSVPDEAKLSFEKRQKLDLRKREVAKVLLTKKADDARARVVLVIDKTGSMHRQYKKKVVHRILERMVPVAVQLDDDGRLEPYLYANWYARLPDVSVHEADEWAENYLHLNGSHGGIDYGRIGGANDELPIMSEIIGGLEPGVSMPTLVLFFTDGGFGKKNAIAQMIRDASVLPAFWQFVGVGKANYGLLETLDTLDGRVIDNAGFFALDDIDRVSDAELYQRLLSEFPDWLRVARAAGILGIPEP